MRGSNKIKIINNLDIYETFKDLYLSEKEYEEKPLESIQSVPLNETHLETVRGLI